MRAAVVVALISTPLASCSDDPKTSATGTGSDGPLRTNLNDGGNSIAAPHKAGPWSGTYGGLLLCSADGSKVEVTGVKYDYKVKPVDAVATMRFVDEPADGKRTMKDTPRITDRATIDQLFPARAYADELGDPAGTQISDECTTHPNAAYHELLTTLTVDKAGGWVDGVDIAYDANGKPYTLHVNWNFVACGSETHTKNVC